MESVSLIPGKPPVWLLIEMDNQPLELARYRILIALVITGLMTLLLLLLCLNFILAAGLHRCMKFVCNYNV
jgi:hypothetical protein